MSRLGALGENSLSVMGSSRQERGNARPPIFPTISRSSGESGFQSDRRNDGGWNFESRSDGIEPHPSATTTTTITPAMTTRDDARRAPIWRIDSNGRSEYELGAYGYGKNDVKLLHVRRENGLRHEIREFEVDTHLRLRTQKDYFEGDNRDVIATDSQKNTVYLLAKKFGVKSPEEFGILLCAHFLYTYGHVEEVHVNVREYPWARHLVDGVPHNHAFVFTPTATRHCQVGQMRNESPKIRGGLENLRVLKTTQSSFTDFVRDEYRTLPDANDRIFSTVVSASWEFSTASGVDFDEVWRTVKDCILQNFAGPPSTGVYSPSVQNTLFLAERSVLEKVEQISSIEMRMPNKHYFDLDLSNFPKLVDGENKQVYLPVDKPSGVIYAQLNRRDLASKL